MKLRETELSYRRLAIEGASPIGLLIVLFDLLAADLRRAATAIAHNDIETRCRELNHAALVLGQLESWVDIERGGKAAIALTAFYAHLRTKMMEAAATKSAKVLDAQIEAIRQVRTAWQKFEATPPAPAERIAEPAQTLVATSPLGLSEINVEHIPFSQSA